MIVCRTKCRAGQTPDRRQDLPQAPQRVPSARRADPCRRAAPPSAACGRTWMPGRFNRSRPTPGAIPASCLKPQGARLSSARKCARRGPRLFGPQRRGKTQNRAVCCTAWQNRVHQTRPRGKTGGPDGGREPSRAPARKKRSRASPQALRQAAQKSRKAGRCCSPTEIADHSAANVPSCRVLAGGGRKPALLLGLARRKISRRFCLLNCGRTG